MTKRKRGEWTARLAALVEKKLALGLNRIKSIRKPPSRARPYTTLPVDHRVR